MTPAKESSHRRDRSKIKPLDFNPYHVRQVPPKAANWDTWLSNMLFWGMIVLIVLIVIFYAVLLIRGGCCS